MDKHTFAVVMTCLALTAGLAIAVLDAQLTELMGDQHCRHEGGTRPWNREEFTFMATAHLEMVGYRDFDRMEPVLCTPPETIVDATQASCSVRTFRDGLVTLICTVGDHGGTCRFE